MGWSTLDLEGWGANILPHLVLVSPVMGKEKNLISDNYYGGALFVTSSRGRRFATIRERWSWDTFQHLCACAQLRDQRDRIEQESHRSVGSSDSVINVKASSTCLAASEF